MRRTRVAINGFGRIGRIVFRELFKNEEIELVAINDLSSPDSLAYLLQYDSNHGRFPARVKSDNGSIHIEGNGSVAVLSERDPANLPWGALEIDVVVESTGVFRDREKLRKHLEAGAKKVVLSAPAKGGDIKTLVIGVNDDELEASDDIISNASCTTNCLAPVAKVIHNNFGIESGFMTTVHAFTNDQVVLDGPHSDFRRGRTASTNIIPTSTGAAQAVGLVLPELKGKLDGMAVRVPVATGSLVDCTFNLNKAATAEAVNEAIKQAAENSLQGILEYTEDPIVSSDIVSSPYSSIFDSQLTSVMGKTVKFLSWYDNEYGYSARTAELVARMGKLIPAASRQSAVQ